jgi:anti-sigma regulatory factor (Ser/Thr protein kinase)
MPDAGPRRAPVMQRPASVVATFSATPSQVICARRFLAELLAPSPLTDDAVLCLSELATNSVRHSASRHRGGLFLVRASTGPDDVRVEVTDSGGPWVTHSAPVGCAVRSGHGLAIVAALATRWGISGGDRGRTVWFEISR